jgi:hypothetical protein
VIYDERIQARQKGRRRGYINISNQFSTFDFMPVIYVLKENLSALSSNCCSGL